MIPNSFNLHPPFLSSHKSSRFGLCEYGRRNGKSLQRLGYKSLRFLSFHLGFSLFHLYSFENDHMVKNKQKTLGIQPTGSKEVRTPDNSHVSEYPWKGILQPQSKFKWCSFIAILWETLSQNHQLSCSQISDPQKLLIQNNKDLLF